MTCFWDGLRKGLNINKSNSEFIIYLKSNNTNNLDIICCDCNLSKKQLDENFQHIKEYDENSINNGYDCSTCDPFLILISHLYNININHNYNGYMIKYINNAECNTILFQSNSNHFWY